MKRVSNRHMRGTSLSLLILLVTSCVPAQGPPADEREAAIQRVKTLLVSSLDHGLPKVTLEFFLNYEGEGGAVKWQVTDCGESVDKLVYHKPDSAICVRADVGLKDGRAATVLISAGRLKKGEANVSDRCMCQRQLPRRDEAPLGSPERFTRGIASSTTQRAQGSASGLSA